MAKSKGIVGNKPMVESNLPKVGTPANHITAMPPMAAQMTPTPKLSRAQARPVLEGARNKTMQTKSPKKAVMSTDSSMGAKAGRTSWSNAMGMTKPPKGY